MATGAELAGRPEIPDLLRRADLEVLGQIADASNGAALVAVREPGTQPGGDPVCHAIYKPVQGERPLWDFPDGCLAWREVAAWRVSEAGGFGAVPPTVLRDGPLGPGSVQLWIEADESSADDVVDLFAEGEVPEGWAAVLTGEDPAGTPVVLGHALTPEIAGITALDCVINNSDRKGSHLLRAGGQVWALDHGVAFHQDDKLRTVLWGLVDQPLPAAALTCVDAVATALESGRLDDLGALLTRAEIRAMGQRCARLIDRGTFPRPAPGWPAVPWPPL